MITRICGILIVAFWLVMMTLLVRQEFFPDLDSTIRVEPRLVMQRLFAATEKSHLRIYQDGEETGQLDFGMDTVEADGQPNIGETLSPLTVPARYRMAAELRINHVHIFWSSYFDKDYQMIWFSGKWRSGSSYISAVCNLTEHTLQLRVKVPGSAEETQTIDLRDFQSSNMASLLNNEAVMQQLQPMLNNMGMSTKSLTAESMRFSALTTRGTLRVSGRTLSTDLVTFRFGDINVLKAWIGAEGQILKVDSPFGLVMLTEGLTLDPAASRPRSRL